MSYLFQLCWQLMWSPVEESCMSYLFQFLPEELMPTFLWKRSALLWKSSCLHSASGPSIWPGMSRVMITCERYYHKDGGAALACWGDSYIVPTGCDKTEPLTVQGLLERLKRRTGREDLLALYLPDEGTGHRSRLFPNDVVAEVVRDGENLVATCAPPAPMVPLVQHAGTSSTRSRSRSRPRARPARRQPRAPKPPPGRHPRAPGPPPKPPKPPTR